MRAADEDKGRVKCNESDLFNINLEVKATSLPDGLPANVLVLQVPSREITRDCHHEAELVRDVAA